MSSTGRLRPIPAGTGETRYRLLPRFRSGAYPRRHGGNVSGHIRGKSANGLSPQARGKRIHYGSAPVGKGPIPAGTGETHGESAVLGISGAYPRRHGGNSISGIRLRSLGGLSPQARGKLQPKARKAWRRGPIPAGTGETDTQIRFLSIQTAYPRRHGGNSPLLERLLLLEGLSPQARGKRASRAGFPPQRGPIPAGTGETGDYLHRTRDGRAYPRRHGGNWFSRHCSPLQKGLSPQARGKRGVR